MPARHEVGTTASRASATAISDEAIREGAARAAASLALLAQSASGMQAGMEQPLLLQLQRQRQLLQSHAVPLAGSSTSRPRAAAVPMADSTSSSSHR